MSKAIRTITISSARPAPALPGDPDARLIAGLDEIQDELAALGRRGGAARYGEITQRIEEIAFTIGRLPATTPEALALKARVVANLNGPGIACYAGRVLAASLGQDVLAREAETGAR